MLRMEVRSSKYEDFVSHDLERYLGWHRRALENPPDQYKACAALITEKALNLPDHDESGLSLLNVCTGNGSLLSYLHSKFPSFKFVGIDTVKELIVDGSALQKTYGNIDLVHAPIKYLHDQAKTYDICVHWMRLLHFSDWQEHLLGMMKVTKTNGHIFVSSLFNDHDVDLLATILDHNIKACQEGFALQYNTFSCEQIRKFCVEHGASTVAFYPYEIPFDIPRQKSGVGSYTLTKTDGKRETISGGVRMQWNFLHIQM